MTDETKEIAVTHSESTSIMAVIERAATNPDVDVTKMQQLLDMQERIMDRNAAQAYSASMVAAQNEMPAVGKDARNDHTKSNYTTSENLIAKIKPVYAKHKLAMSFSEGESNREGYIRILCDVTHADGHTKQYHHDLPLDDKGIQGSANKTAVHATGSTVSYGRRYLTMMIFNISTGDDNDGNNGIEYVTPDQIASLEALIKELKANESAFCKFLMVKHLGAIPATQYANAVAALEKKRGLSEEQCLQLHAFLTENDLDSAAVSRKLGSLAKKYGVANHQNIPADKFDDAMATLKDAMKGRGGES